MRFRTAILLAGVGALALFQASTAHARTAYDPLAATQVQSGAPAGTVRTATLIELLVVIARSEPGSGKADKTRGKISNADCSSRSGRVVSKGSRMFCDIPDGKTAREAKSLGSSSGFPKRQNNGGTGVAAGDVNGDGRADFFKRGGPGNTKR